MDSRKDRLVELTLEEALGKAPPDLTGKVMAALDRPLPLRASAPPARLSIYWPWVAAAAAVLIIAVALLLRFTGGHEPALNDAIIAQPDNSGAPGRNTGPLTTPWQGPRDQDGKPRAPGVDQPAQPGPSDTQPNDKPAEKPGEMVEQPAPPARNRPDSARPTEDKPKPGPAVEKPPVVEPPQPAEARGPTEATPSQPVVAATVAYIPEGADLHYTPPAGREVKIKTNIELMTGWTLETRNPVALDFGGGIRGWFDGKISLGKDGDTPIIEMLRGSVFIQAQLAKGTLSVRRGELSVKVEDAELLAECFSNTNLKVACLGGEIAWGESKLEAGQRAILSGRGFQRERNEGARLREERMLQIIARAKNQWREDFEARGTEFVFAGEVEGGRVLGAAREPSVGLSLPGGHTLRKQATLRLRIKSSIKGAVAVQLLGPVGPPAEEKNAKFHRDVNLEADQWTVIALPIKLAEGRDAAQATFARFQAQAKHKGAQIEIDWIEISEEP